MQLEAIEKDGITRGYKGSLLIKVSYSCNVKRNNWLSNSNSKALGTINYYAVRTINMDLD